MTKAELIKAMEDLPSTAEILIYDQENNNVYDFIGIDKDSLERINTVYFEICSDY